MESTTNKDAGSAERELLKRIRQWDHLDGAADGDYWKREIDACLIESKDALRWTTETPKVPGWYFHENGGLRRVRHLSEHGTHPSLRTDDGVFVKHVGGLWAGPIQEPPA